MEHLHFLVKIPKLLWPENEILQLTNCYECVIIVSNMWRCLLMHLTTFQFSLYPLVSSALLCVFCVFKDTSSLHTVHYVTMTAAAVNLFYSPWSRTTWVSQRQKHSWFTLVSCHPTNYCCMPIDLFFPSAIPLHHLTIIPYPQPPSKLSWVSSLTLQPPRAGSGVVRIDPLHFLARYCTRRLNQV